MEEARVPIPIVGGIDDSTDPLALRPPNLATSENTKMPRRGAVAKRHGWGGLLDTRTGPPLVVAGQDRLLTLGNNGGQVVKPDGTLVDLSTPALFPTETTTIPVAAPGGYVHSVQCAASDSYICVVWSFVGDVATAEPSSGADLATPLYAEADFQVGAAILDTSGAPVWGPHILAPSMKILPRVEAVGDGTFAVFAIGPGSSVSDYNLLGYEEKPIIYACRYDVGVVPGAATGLAVCFLPSYPEDEAYDPPRSYTIYDTTVATVSGTSIALVAANHLTTGSQRRVRVRGFISSAGTETDLVPTWQGPADLAIEWDADSQTVLVYDGGDKLVYYSDSSLSFSSVAAPTLLNSVQAGTDTGFGYAFDPGPARNRPHFYYDEDGDLYLNERPVTITGTAPGTPSFGSAGTERLPLVFEPVVINDHVVYAAFSGTRRLWNDAIALSELQYPYKVGASAIDMYYLDGNGAIAPLASLGETRHGDPGHPCYEWLSHRNVGSTSTTTVDPTSLSTGEQFDYGPGPHVRGQVAVIDGVAYFPFALLTSLQNPRGAPSEYADTPAWAARMYKRASPNCHGGAGFYNDEQTVALLRVAADSPPHTAAPFGRARILGAGGVRIWSTQRSLHSLALRKPTLRGDGLLSSVDELNRRVDPEAVGVDPDSGTGTGHPVFTGLWRACVVLVATDGDGRQYRSPPSNTVFGWEGPGADTPPDYCPVFDVYPHFAVQELLDAGLSVDVELYTTPRAEGQATALDEIDLTDFALVGRMPLLQDDTGFYVVDLMRDYARSWIDSTFGWGIPAEMPPRGSVALYTQTELAPYPPPAANAIARAGEYLFLIPSEAPQELWYSKPLVAGRAPEFSPLLTTYLPPEAGHGISLAGTYDRLYVLTERGVLELPAGVQGPDANASGSFPPFRLTYEGDPCVTHMGTVTTPMGVFYVSRSGPKLIDPSGQPADIGAVVQDRVDWTGVLDAVYHEAASEVIWFTSATAVVFNVVTGAWSTIDMLTASADVLGGVLYRINQAGNLRAESASSTTDGAAYPLATITTGWVDLGDQQAYKRFNEITLLGRLENTPTLGTLLVKIAYNYDDTVVDTFTWNWTAVPRSATNTFQLEVHPTVSKVDSMKITVTEGTTTVGQTTGNDALWTLAGIEARVRGKRGLTKQPAEGKK